MIYIWFGTDTTILRGTRGYNLPDINLAWDIHYNATEYTGYNLPHVNLAWDRHYNATGYTGLQFTRCTLVFKMALYVIAESTIVE